MSSMDATVTKIEAAQHQSTHKSSLSMPIYMDYAATTPVDPRVVERMTHCLSRDGVFGNPASRSHQFGWQAEELVEKARRQVAELLNVDAREIVWTSGATEASNLALKGAAAFYRSRGTHVVTSSIEHKSVLDTCRQLERNGFTVTYIDPDKNGIVQPSALEKALRDDTILVSIMHANNEIGTLNDIAAFGEITRPRKILLHVDAVQSVGKIPLDLQAIKVDMLSLTAHKFYGPKGVGALFLRRKPRVRIEAQTHGGGHERGIRSGTLPTHQIVGLGEACRIAAEEMATEGARIKTMRRRLWAAVQDLEEVYLNGHEEQNMPGVLNISFNYVEGEALMMALKDVAVSSGSACTSASLEPSYVLRALGLNDELAHSSLRFSLGRYTTAEEVDYVAKKLREAVLKLRAMSPLWDMYKEGVDLETVQWSTH